MKFDEKNENNIDIKQDEEKTEKSMTESLACKAKHVASSAVDSLKQAKEYVAEKVNNPGEVVDGVKAWGSEKAVQADSLLDKLEAMVVKVGDAIAQLRGFVAEKADKLDRTLETSQGVLSNAELTLGQAHDWAREKAVKLGDVMDKSREAIERSAERLAAQTEELRVKSREALDRAKEYSVQAREEFDNIKSTASEKFEEIKSASVQGKDLAADELNQKIEAARQSIRETEFKLRQMGIDPEGIRLYGTSNPEAQVLREQLLEEEQQLEACEIEMRRGHQGQALKITPEKH